MSTTEAGHSLLVPGTSVVATAILSSGAAAVPSIATPVVSLVATAVVSTVASTPTHSSVAGSTLPAGKYLF